MTSPGLGAFAMMTSVRLLLGERALFSLEDSIVDCFCDADGLEWANRPVKGSEFMRIKLAQARSMGSMLHLKPVVFSGLGYFSMSCCSVGADGSNGFRVLR